MRYRETELGLLPVEWEVLKIEDVAEVVGGGTPRTKIEEYWNGEISWITPKDLSNYNSTYIYKGERSITKIGLDNSSAKILPKGTVLFSSRAPIGYIAIAGKELSTNQGFKSIVCNEEKINNRFLYHLMRLKKYELENIAGGSTFKEVSGKTVKEFKIQVPPLIEQKAIAKILSSLDEKIEINNQINKTLEKIAQTIFKHWFIDFEFSNEDGESYKSSGGKMVESELGLIPKGWEIVNLNDIAIITMGQSPKGSSYNEEGKGSVFYQGRTDFTSRFPFRRLYTTEPKRMAKCGDILMSVRAPVGDINIATEDCCIGRGICSIRSKDKMDSYLLYLLLELKSTFDIFNGEGTVFGSINQNELKKIKVIVPNSPPIKCFNKIATKLDNKYLYNEKESRLLSKIRDTLLSKLMSGEIRIPLEEDNI